MTRRVIYPAQFFDHPHDEPQETTDMIHLTATDLRRAGALVCLFVAGDLPGTNVMSREAAAEDRLTELFCSVIEVLDAGIQVNLSDAGYGCAMKTIARFAEELEDDDARRAAGLVTAYTTKDIGGTNAVLLEAERLQRAGELLSHLITLYNVICPLMFTPECVGALRATIAEVSNMEAPQ